MKLSDLTDEQWFRRLSARRETKLATIKYWWDYYDGTQPLYYVAKILAEQEDRFPALTINWCQKFIDSIDRRCNVEGFRLDGTDTADEDLWTIWQRNDLDEFQSENNVASLVTGDSYMMVGPSSEGALVTVESSDAVAVEVDPLSRRTVASLLFYKSDSEQTTDDRAVLQLPGRLVQFDNGKKAAEQAQKWMAGPGKLQSSPEVPVVRFPNRQRRRQGRSELAALTPIVDAANQVATNMMAAVEHHAVPRKWALGVSQDSFRDADGNELPAWKIATGAVWANPYDEDNPAATPSVGQFPQSDLRNFHDTIGMLARIGAGLCDMSPHTFGFGVADNPASGDGIKEARVDFTGRVERTLVERGTSYERVMRLAAAVEGMDPSKMGGLETIWRDPSTPTKSAMADAAVKTLGSGISDLHQARVDYGYSATTIAAMEEREQAAGADPYLAQLAAKDQANAAPAVPASGN